MSIHDHCQAYRSSSAGYWKHALSNIVAALKRENHPDAQLFASASCSLMMNDTPGYWRWLNVAITKLIEDPTSPLDPLPDLPEYHELSSRELIDKYETDDGDYMRRSILEELRCRYPLVIKTDEPELITDLKERLKDVI
jgi:hypothetical protein